MPAPKERAKQFERDRGSARQRGYNPMWDRLAKLFKVSHPLCLGCQAVDRIEPTTIVDHVIPHNGDPVLMWDEDNWQPSCTPHHSIVKQKLERLFAKGEATKADLRLDSPLAIELTHNLLR